MVIVEEGSLTSSLYLQPLPSLRLSLSPLHINAFRYCSGFKFFLRFLKFVKKKKISPSTLWHFKKSVLFLMAEPLEKATHELSLLPHLQPTLSPLQSGYVLTIH